jgi:DNA-directed RNA polymerase specialized sigma24 family protein
MDIKKLSIRELLQLCLDSGEEDAWTEFLSRIQGPIAAVISRTLGKLGQRSTVDDLVQNTWVKLFDNDRAALRRIRNEHENSIYAYVRSAAFHVAHDFIRGRVPSVSLEELVAFEPTNSKWTDVFKDLRWNEVDRCLKTLSSDPNFERDYAIFGLYYKQGYSSREVAEIKRFKLSESGVEGVLLRLTRYVKGKLEPPNPPGSSAG